MRSAEFEAGTIDTGFIDLNLGRLGAEPRPPDTRALHAAARLLIERRDEGRASPLNPFDPWRIADSFELIGSRRIGLDVAVDGVPARVHLVEGANVEPFAEGEAASGGEITLYETDGGAYAFAGGRQAFVELIDPFAKAEAGPDDSDAAIRAPMNGRLVALAVEDGETVEAGQRLAVVEAMKMEHALVAPHAGVVRDLNASLGDQVEMGERLMRVEREGGRAGRRRLTSRPASASVSRAPGAAGPPEFNQSASSGESERKKKKEKESQFAFFRFLLLFGIEPFQKVTAEKSRKNLPPFSLAHELHANRSMTAHASVPRPALAQAGLILSIGIIVVNVSGFGKNLQSPEFAVGPRLPNPCVSAAARRRVAVIRGRRPCACRRKYAQARSDRLERRSSRSTRRGCGRR